MAAKIEVAYRLLSTVDIFYTIFHEIGVSSKPRILFVRFCPEFWNLKI